MRALVTNGYGPPSNLAITEVEQPSPAAGQVLVRLEAASVNPFDVQLISGSLKEYFPLRFPYVIGMDGVGTVVTVGDGVTRFAAGDQVLGMLRETPGTVAEYALANAGSPLLARRPAALGPVKAAALPEAGLMALTLLRAATPQPGQTALVIGASGGIGMVLVPLLATAGVTVVATASAADDGYVRRLGAADTIDYTTVDTIGETLRRHPHGVDLVVNLVLDEPAVAAAARAARPGGRLVSARPIRGQGEGAFGDSVAIASPMLAAAPGDLEELAARAASGALPVEVSQVYPFERAAQAFVDHVARHTRGKLAIAVG